MSIRLDNLLAARGRSEGVLSVPPPSPPAPTPMELHLGGPGEEAPPAPTAAGDDTLRTGAGGVCLGVELQAEHFLATPGE